MALTNEMRARVERATVRLTNRGGLGTLVPGGFIVSATHCVDWDGTGGMALGDHYVEPIETSDGASVRAGPMFADPISDLAVLSALDNQVFPAEWQSFEEWRERTEPIPLSSRGWRAEANELVLEVQCLAHTGEWIPGRARRFTFEDIGPRVYMETSFPIRKGTSGGPIVDNNGALVAVVSQAIEVSEGPCDGLQPVLAQALPVWLIRQIRKAGGGR